MANTFTLNKIPGVSFPWFRRPSIEIWRKLKQYTYERDGGKCRYCGLSVEYLDTHCHHIMPLSEGGTNHPDNLKTLCRDCHKKRHPFMFTAREKLHKAD
jgi:5-methylcytosine-specific restriction endonuclease McrA